MPSSQLSDFFAAAADVGLATATLAAWIVLQFITARIAYAGIRSNFETTHRRPHALRPYIALVLLPCLWFATWHATAYCPTPADPAAECKMIGDAFRIARALFLSAGLTLMLRWWSRCGQLIEAAKAPAPTRPGAVQ